MYIGRTQEIKSAYPCSSSNNFWLTIPISDCLIFCCSDLHFIEKTENDKNKNLTMETSKHSDGQRDGRTDEQTDESDFIGSCRMSSVQKNFVKFVIYLDWWKWLGQHSKLYCLSAQTIILARKENILRKYRPIETICKSLNDSFTNSCKHFFLEE